MLNAVGTPATGQGRLPDPLSGPRTVVFLIALGVIFGSARGGASRAFIVGAFVLFTIAATLWVRGQYHDSLDSRRWVLPWEWTFVLGVGTATVLAYWLLITFTDVDVAERKEQAGSALLIGVVLGYLLVGFLLVRWRASGSSRVWWGLAALGVGSLAGAAGLLLLGHVGTGWSLGLLAVALFTLPPGLALLSEVAIERLEKPDAPRRASVIGGTALLLAAVGAAYVWVRTPLVVLAFAALGLLVLALASSTLADIAVVLALIAFMGITPRQAAPPSAPEPGKSDVLVALGDSYMSGEGASTFYEGTDDGGTNGCRRSPTAWAAIVGRHEFGGLEFLACSGARTYNVRANGKADPRPHRQYDEPGTQLRQYENIPADERFTPALVVLSIGGNDVGFATIGQMCVAPGDCSKKWDLWLGALDDVEKELEATYAEVRDAFPNTPIAVTPYPNPIYSPADDGTPPKRCGQVSLLFEERKFISDFVTQLNLRIDSAVTAQKDDDFHYIAGMEDALANEGLQLCDPANRGQPGLNFIGLRSVNGDPSQRFNPTNWVHNSLHPNERGHAAMVTVFQRWWDALNAPEGTAPAQADEDGQADLPESVARVCDVYGDLPERVYSQADGNGCQSQGTEWALQQLGGTAFLSGVGGGFGALGAWAVSVAFFAWRRRRWKEARPRQRRMPSIHRRRRRG